MLQSSLSRTCQSGGMPNQQERERTPSAFAKINHDSYFANCNRDLSFIERSFFACFFLLCALFGKITSVSTLLAPILTPALILLLAGKWLSVSAGALFWSIVKVVLIPIILGLIVQMMFQKQVKASVQILPLVSVIAIVAIVAAVVGLNQQAIAKSGFIIFLIVVVHNGLGLLIGYWLAKLLRMSEPKQKAISIEVGMQNSGLGAALATAHFSPLAAVPSAIFSVWHNISGPIVATYFRKKK